MICSTLCTAGTTSAWLVKCPTRPSAHFNIKIPSDCKAGSRRFSNLQIVKTTCVLYHPRLSSSTIFHPWHIFLSKERDCRAGININVPFLIIQFAREKQFSIIKCFNPPKSFIINLDAFDDFGTMYTLTKNIPALKKQNLTWHQSSGGKKQLLKTWTILNYNI